MKNDKGIFFDHGKYYVDYYVNGRRKRECVGLSKREAILVRNKRLIEIQEGKFFDRQSQENIKLFDIVDGFLVYSKANKRSYGRDIELTGHLKDYFGNVKLPEITPEKIEQYKTKRLEQDKRKPGTVNREIACLKCIFNQAIMNKKTKENPMKYVKLLEENNERKRYLTPEEMKRLLDAAPWALRNIIDMAINTGMRKGEILSLKWTNVDFTNSIITFADNKSRKHKIKEIPFNESIAEILGKCKQNTDGEYVFCNEDGKQYRKIDTLFEVVCKRAEITDFHFHDLRHTAGSYMAMAGLNALDISRFLGHSSLKMTERYMHLAPKHTRQAMQIFNHHLATIWPASDKNEGANNTVRATEIRSLSIDN